MTSEMSEKFYQAVRCSYRSEPIPLSTQLLKLFVAEFDSPAELQCRGQVFILRCAACFRESCYLKTEIETFESESLRTDDIDRFGLLRSLRSYRKAAVI